MIGIRKYRIRTPFCGHLSPRTTYSGQSAGEVSGNTAYEGLFVDTSPVGRFPRKRREPCEDGFVAVICGDAAELLYLKDEIYPCDE